jgi:hypothetical protein
MVFVWRYDVTPESALVGHKGPVVAELKVWL